MSKWRPSSPTTTGKSYKSSYTRPHPSVFGVRCSSEKTSAVSVLLACVVLPADSPAFSFLRQLHFPVSASV